jgi:ankyrin repeat protein
MKTLLQSCWMQVCILAQFLGLCSVVSQVDRSGYATGYVVKDTPDRDGITPLMLAATNGHASVVELMLKTSADKHLKDSSGCTAAHHAAKNSHQDCLDLLLDAGSHLLAADCMGRLLIHLAAINGDVQMVESLVTRGCPVNGGEVDPLVVLSQEVLAILPQH